MLAANKKPKVERKTCFLFRIVTVTACRDVLVPWRSSRLRPSADPTLWPVNSSAQEWPLFRQKSQAQVRNNNRLINKKCSDSQAGSRAHPRPETRWSSAEFWQPSRGSLRSLASCWNTAPPCCVSRCLRGGSALSNPAEPSSDWSSATGRRSC